MMNSIIMRFLTNLPIIIERFHENPSIFSYEDPYSVSGVLRAVILGDLEKIKSLLQEGKSPNINDNHGNTPLHVAVIKHLPDIVDFLLNCDEVNINNRNFYGETALFWGVKRGQLQIVERLVKADANVNLPNFEDVTPLHIAANNPPIVNLLIKSGAKLDARDYSGETAMHEAVSENCLETVCMLLYYGADANAQCDNGITPFMKAVLLDKSEIQSVLLNYVVDFNTITNDGMTLLNLALTHSCPYVKEIIDGGADVNYKHRFLNAFIMCLEVPNINNFRLIWKDFKYQKLYTNFSYLEQMLVNMEEHEFLTYLRVVFNSNNLTPIFQHFDFVPLYSFVKFRVNSKDSWLPIVYEFIFLYLSYGYPLKTDTIKKLFDLFGYNIHLYQCLHMDIEESDNYSRITFARVLYDTKLKMNDFKYLISEEIRRDMLPLQEFARYIRIPTTFKHLENYSEEYKTELNNMCQLPSLLELARNAARDHLVNKFGLYTSKEYYLFVQNMQVSEVYKHILNFRRTIYAV